MQFPDQKYDFNEQMKLSPAELLSMSKDQKMMGNFPGIEKGADFSKNFSEIDSLLKSRLSPAKLDIQQIPQINPNQVPNSQDQQQATFQIPTNPMLDTNIIVNQQNVTSQPGTVPNLEFPNQTNPHKANDSPIKQDNYQQLFLDTQKVLQQPQAAQNIFVPQPVGIKFQTTFSKFNQTLKGNEDQYKIDQLTEEIKQLEEKLDNDREKYQKFIKNENAELDHLYQTIVENEAEVYEIEEKVKTERFKQTQALNEIKQLEEQLKFLKTELEDFEQKQMSASQIQSNVQQIAKIKSENNLELQEWNKKNENLEIILKKNENEIKSLKKTFQEQQKHLENNLYTQNDFENSLIQIENEKKYLQETSDLINVLVKKKEILKKDDDRKTQEIENMNNLLIEKNREKDQLIKNINGLEYNQKQEEGQINQIKELLEILFKLQQTSKINQPNQQNPANNMNKQFKEILDNVKKNQELRSQQIEELKNQSIDQSIIQLNSKQIQQKAQQKKRQEEQNVIGQKKIEEAMQTHGQLDVCFLVDVTGSMESYKEQTKKSVQQSLKVVKQVCNRETNWAAICYQDFAELKKLGQYHQFSFSKDSKKIEQWLDTIKCSGGGDGAEDIRGAIKQMCKLNWKNKFKIAILICDAPTHGEKYNGNCGDDHPDEDIRDAILQMIENNILFIGLNFKKITSVMYQEIQKIYVEKNKTELFLFADFQNLNIEQAAAQMAQWIGKASANATQTNKSSTKTKNQVQQTVDKSKTQEGAMEALCKLTDFNNFEQQQNISKINVAFKVLRIEIKEISFENILTQIRNLRIPDDIQISEEGKWDCVRTEKPFAFGMMKDVFLMKKLNNTNDELYVIKTPKGSQPYQSRNDAITECRSHLICQSLMKKFQNDIEQQQAEKQINIVPPIPKVVYSDFLILEESPTKYWIAERFFKGEFVKYNNNYGYINDENTQFNKLAQAFSFYTFVISGFNYIISDVQGVDKYFTDPAVNTKEGNYDDTDMGEDGIRMYLVTYNQKKEILSKEILQLLNMYK